jgi:hypothetical protein
MTFLRRLLHYDEDALVYKMIKIYCFHYHGTAKSICDDCSDLYRYSSERLRRCPHGMEKPVCANCKIHCYKKEYREKMKEVMRYSGPRVLFYKPVASIKHLLKEKIYRC